MRQLKSDHNKVSSITPEKRALEQSEHSPSPVRGTSEGDDRTRTQVWGPNAEGFTFSSTLQQTVETISVNVRGCWDGTYIHLLSMWLKPQVE